MTIKIRKYAVATLRPENLNPWLDQDRYSGMEDTATQLETIVGEGAAFAEFATILTKIRASDPIARNSNNSIKLFEGYTEIKKNSNLYLQKFNSCIKTNNPSIREKELRKVIDFVNFFADSDFPNAQSFDVFFQEQEKKQKGKGKELRKNIADMIALVRYYGQECDKIMRTKKQKKQSKKYNSINKYSQSMLYTNKTGYHNEFYRDALKGLGSSDPLLKDFYKGLQQEYHKDLKIKPQKRGDLMDFFYEEEHLMSKAHPDSIVIADARHGGELLENNLEKHKKLVDIAQRRPLGNFK